MKPFRWFLAAAMVFSIVASVRLIADDQKGSGELSSKELELKACGPKDKEVDYSTETDKSQHPVPEQPADKALVYVLRPSMMGNKVQTKLAVDGEWKGLTSDNPAMVLGALMSSVNRTFTPPRKHAAISNASQTERV